MAKELPYFKFEPSEWQNGNIQMCSIEARLIFVDICCSYWQRLGDLPYAFALQRHCNGNENVMQELENAEVLQNDQGDLIIKFLDEQIEELSKKSAKARKSALKRWDKSERNANASKTQSEGNAIRREEKRIDKNINNNNNKIDFDAFISELGSSNHQMWRENFYMKFKLKPGSLSDLLQVFKVHLGIKDQEQPKDLRDFKEHFYNWCNVQDRVQKLGEYKKGKKEGAL